MPQLNATLGLIQAISKRKQLQSFFSRFGLGLLFDFTSFLDQDIYHVTRRRVTPRAADARPAINPAVPLTTTTTYRQRFNAKPKLLYILAYISPSPPRRQDFFALSVAYKKPPT